MKDILLILALGLYVVWGYRLMGRLDHFLNEYVKNDEDEMNDQQHHDGK